MKKAINQEKVEWKGLHLCTHLQIHIYTHMCAHICKYMDIYILIHICIYELVCVCRYGDLWPECNNLQLNNKIKTHLKIVKRFEEMLYFLKILFTYS